jgi:hypothetical protein
MTNLILVPDYSGFQKPENKLPEIQIQLDSIPTQKIPKFNEMISCQGCSKQTPRYEKCTKLCPTCKHERQKARCRRYKATNSDYISQYNQQYKSVHKDEISSYNHNYNKENREAITAYRRDREQNDPVFRMRLACASRISAMIREKKADYKTMELLGCSYEHLKKWIEFQSSSEITLDNYGSYWHLDHVIPCAKFDLSKDEEIKKCFHWTNVQPLEAKRNTSKGDRTHLMEQILQEIKINVFLKTCKNNDYTTLAYDRSQYLL